LLLPLDISGGKLRYLVTKGDEAAVPALGRDPTQLRNEVGGVLQLARYT
jgi:hypothetical protein